jgi:type IV pilus assembly protein PilX
MITKNYSTISRQRGAVLFVALVFLLLLTLLGLTASSTSILQERMTGGMRNSQLAMMGSESALRGGEVDLWTAAARSSFASGGLALPPCGHSGVQPCVYQRTNGISDQRAVKFRASKQWLSATNDGAATYSGVVSGLTGGDATASLASQPRYLIEDLGLDTGASGPGNMGGAILSEPGAEGAPKVHLFRVTARSQGGTNTLLRASESVFGAASISQNNTGNGGP